MGDLILQDVTMFSVRLAPDGQASKIKPGAVQWFLPVHMVSGTAALSF